MGEEVRLPIPSSWNHHYMLLKILSVVAQPHSYVSTNFGPFV